MNLLKKILPWWTKIIIKVIFERLFFSYKTLAKLNLVRHGQMDNLDYAISVFEKHYKYFKEKSNKSAFSFLELGSGDSVSSGIIAYYFGCHNSYLVDTDDFVINEISQYQNLIEIMNKKFPDKTIVISELKNFEDLLSKCHINYLTDGTDSMRKLDSKTIDFSFSQAVLEHVWKNEFTPLFNELHRVMKDDGVSSHTIDLRDHLSESLNNLRFSESIWESSAFKRSSFYTNRIRMSRMVELIERSGFKTQITNTVMWDQMPIAKEKLNSEFQKFEEKELLVSSFSLTLTKIL